MVGDGIARDAPDPGFHAVGGTQGWELSLDPEEHLLQDVVRDRVIADTGPDERAKLARERYPDGFRRRGHVNHSSPARSKARRVSPLQWWRRLRSLRRCCPEPNYE